MLIRSYIKICEIYVSRTYTLTGVITVSDTPKIPHRHYYFFSVTSKLDSVFERNDFVKIVRDLSECIPETAVSLVVSLTTFGCSGRPVCNIRSVI